MEVSEQQLDRHKKLYKLKTWLSKALYSLFIKGHLLLFIVSFLLGRAVILFYVSPFVLALLATVWIVQREKVFQTACFILLGSWTYSLNHLLFIALLMTVFLFLVSIFKRQAMHIRYMMVFIFLSTTLTRLFFFSLFSTLTMYEWLFLLVESTLATILLLIFMQSIPLLSPKRYRPTLQNEEIISIVILLASILTGMIGWEIYSASIEHIFSRYFVLIIAYAGGAAIGSTVGVVTGLILSLANV